MTPTPSSVRPDMIEIGTVPAIRPAADPGADDRDRPSRGNAASTTQSHLPVPAGRQEPPIPGQVSASLRPQAPLVAQLIATHLGLPQTRNLRRAGNDQARSAYRDAATLGPVAPSRRDRRI
ncbi:hypothetical protein [Microbaculum marinisediminis]|uniref:Uncharacterized protein n=1 Tax=Microbaculum marinisediminis TaxID=2931392 RepID=A0AAW5QWJ3_9HYPH|nr:hypothetical protein [Microbaculum sp. A6E488]MCT8972441.1 hypothetical protein [Microbaculum sp. A6E488]